MIIINEKVTNLFERVPSDHLKGDANVNTAITTDIINTRIIVANIISYRVNSVLKNIIKLQLQSMTYK